MSDEIARAERTRREFNETDAAFQAVRDAMVSRLLGSSVTETEIRERLYFGVQVLDAVRKAMMDAISTGEIELYAESIREGRAL